MPFRRASRWWLVAAAAAVLGVAGTYQFTWSTLRLPLGARIGAAETALGTVFTLFVVFQTVSQYPAGWVRDRYGPRIPVVVGGALMISGYGILSLASSLPHAYLGYVVGGAGNGAVYTVAVNTPVKWFDERRGLATGIVSMSYAGFSFLLIPGVRRGVAVDFRMTTLALGGLAAAAALVAVATLRDPDVDTREGESNASDPGPTYEWRQTIRTWQFWLMYAIFVVVNGVGLMLIGKVITLTAKLGLPAAAGTTAASLIALADSAGIAVVGGLSDRIGRERALGASLVLSGLALAAAITVGLGDRWLIFVGLVTVAAFFRSPAFSVLPTIVGEYYGTARSSENFALLYTAKLWGGVIGGTVASALVITIGWAESFLIGSGLLVVAGLASFLLRSV